MTSKAPARVTSARKIFQKPGSARRAGQSNIAPTAVMPACGSGPISTAWRRCAG